MRSFPGFENFAPAVAYHFCLNLPAALSQTGNGLTEILCTVLKSTIRNWKKNLAITNIDCLLDIRNTSLINLLKVKA